MRSNTDPKLVLRRLNKVALHWADNPASLEYLLRTNLEEFTFLRSAGLSWGQISRGLPDWTRRAGGPISTDQFRGAYSRLSRKRKTPVVERKVEVAAAPREAVHKPLRQPGHFEERDGQKSGQLLARLRQTAKARE